LLTPRKPLSPDNQVDIWLGMTAIMKHFSFKSLTFTTLSLGFALFGASTVANAFGVGVQPSTVEMAVKPGMRQTQVITIGNVHKEKTISLNIGLADWSLNEQGRLVLAPPGETDKSAADWIRFSPASVTLKPETSQDVKVEIDVPYKTQGTGDRRFALLATTILPSVEERGEESGVWNRYQLASLFYLTLTPAKSLPKITSVEMDELNPTKITMQIENPGDAHARIMGDALVKDSSGETLAKAPLNVVVLDDAERTYELNMQALSALDKGDYKIEFDIQNSFAPQNKFKPLDMTVKSLEFTTE